MSRKYTKTEKRVFGVIMVSPAIIMLIAFQPWIAFWIVAIAAAYAGVLAIVSTLQF